MSGTAGDHYQTLGVARAATAAEIRTAYFKLVRVHTPEDAPERFQAISEAYRVLSDPEERKRYDATVRLPAAVEAALAKASGLVATDAAAAVRLAQAIAAKPGMPAEARHAAAAICGEAKEPKAAVAILEEVVRLQPDRPQFAVSLGRALAAAGDARRAEEVLRGVLASHPAHLGAMHALASLLGERGAEEEALNLVERGVRSEAAAGLRGLAFQLVKLRVLGRAGRFADLDRAVGAIRRGIPQGDEDAAAHVAQSLYVLGEEHVSEEAFDVAKRLIDAALAVVPHAGIAKRSEALAPHAARSAACRTAYADARVPEWIRRLMPPAFGGRMTDADWKLAIGGAQARVSRLGAKVDREWAAFAKAHPLAAERVAPVWKTVRDSGTARGAARKEARKSGRNRQSGPLEVALVVLLLLGLVVALIVVKSREPSDLDRFRAEQEAIRRRALENLKREPTSEQIRAMAADRELLRTDPEAWERKHADLDANLRSLLRRQHERDSGKK